MNTEAQFRTCMSMCNSSELAAVRRVAVSDAIFWIDDTYRSMTAASITMDVLRIIDRRLPNLEELVFVPREEDEARRYDPDDTLQRMHDQVDTAVNMLAQQNIAYRVPAWHISGMEALHNAAG